MRRSVLLLLPLLPSEAKLQPFPTPAWLDIEIYVAAAITGVVAAFAAAITGVAGLALGVVAVVVAAVVADVVAAAALMFVSHK